MCTRGQLTRLAKAEMDDKHMRSRTCGDDQQARGATRTRREPSTAGAALDVIAAQQERDADSVRDGRQQREASMQVLRMAVCVAPDGGDV